MEAAEPDLGNASLPRVYDSLLGGKDNYAADRAMAGRLEAVGLGVRRLARDNRAFVIKASRWAGAVLSVGQVLDLGCGLPATPAVHEAAREGFPGAVVAYVDRDPVVLSHARALQSGPGIAVVEADVADPSAVLTDEAVRGLIRFHVPLAVILGGTLSTMDADTARAAVKGYADAMTAGSCAVISCASYRDPARGERMASMLSPAGAWHNHTREDIEAFFSEAGLRIVHDRVMNLACWPACAAAGAADADAAMLGGIGIRD